MARRSLAALFVLFALRASAVAGTRCTTTCEPTNSDSTYTTQVAQARPTTYNERAMGTVFAPKAEGSATNAGSESYNYSIPLLHLPGRAGMDLDLTLYYNSRVWTVNKSANT